MDKSYGLLNADSMDLPAISEEEREYKRSLN